MAGDDGLNEAEVWNYFADAFFAIAEEFNDFESIGVRECVEDLGFEPLL